MDERGLPTWFKPKYKLLSIGLDHFDNDMDVRHTVAATFNRKCTPNPSEESTFPIPHLHVNTGGDWAATMKTLISLSGYTSSKRGDAAMMAYKSVLGNVEHPEKDTFFVF